MLEYLAESIATSLTSSCSPEADFDEYLSVKEGDEALACDWLDDILVGVDGETNRYISYVMFS